MGKLLKCWAVYLQLLRALSIIIRYYKARMKLEVLSSLFPIIVSACSFTQCKKLHLITLTIVAGEKY